MTEFFHIERGIRQGCPLSVYLFLLVAETLANKLRENKEIKGISIGDSEVKISQLADDTTIFLSDINSIKLVLNTLNNFV